MKKFEIFKIWSGHNILGNTGDTFGLFFLNRWCALNSLTWQHSKQHYGFTFSFKKVPISDIDAIFTKLNVPWCFQRNFVRFDTSVANIDKYLFAAHIYHCYSVIDREVFEIHNASKWTFQTMHRPRPCYQRERESKQLSLFVDRFHLFIFANVPGKTTRIVEIWAKWISFTRLTIDHHPLAVRKTSAYMSKRRSAPKQKIEQFLSVCSRDSTLLARRSIGMVFTLFYRPILSGCSDSS